MKKTMFALVSCLLVVCMSMPMLVSTPVTAAPVAPLRNHIIKSIYFGWTAVLNHAYVVEFYYSPVSKLFRVQRGPFIQYDSYTKWIGFGGNWIFFKIYLG